MLFAAAHIVGAFIALMAFGAGLMCLNAWEQEREKDRRVRDAALALRIPASEVESEVHRGELLAYLASRYSSELFRNRLADFCGWIRAGWGVLGWVAQLATVGGVFWAMAENGAKNAVYLWAVLAVAVYFWLMSVGFSFVCMLLTGRFPHEPRTARRAVAAFIEHQLGSGKQGDGFDRVVVK